jgi:hypothetical protein
MRITVGGSSYDLAELPEEVLKKLGIIEDDPFARLFPPGLIHRPYNPAPIVSENEPFYSRKQLAQLWRQAVAQKKRRQAFATSSVPFSANEEPTAATGPTTSAATTQPMTTAAQPSTSNQDPDYLKHHFQSAQPTPDMPAYSPDWSIKFTPILSSLDQLTRDQLQSYKNEAYNRYVYSQYQLKIARRDHLPVDIALYQAESDYWSTVFRKVDTALFNATTQVKRLNDFLNRNDLGPLIYGTPYSGPTIGESGVLANNEEVFEISRPFTRGAADATLVALGGHGSPTTPELPEVDDDTGFTDPKLARRAINPSIATNEQLENRVESAATVATGLAAGLNEALRGGRVFVDTYVQDHARYLVVVDPNTGTQLSPDQGRYILSHWAGTPAANLPKAPDE